MIGQIGMYVLYAVGAIAAFLLFLLASYFVARYCGWFAYCITLGYRTAKSHSEPKDEGDD